MVSRSHFWTCLVPFLAANCSTLTVSYPSINRTEIAQGVDEWRDGDRVASWSQVQYIVRILCTRGMHSWYLFCQPDGDRMMATVR